MGISWDNTLSVGVEEIDDQHRRFVAILDDAYSHFQKMRPREELRPILEQLVKYMEFHFATEERYFDEFKYEFADEHRTAHRGLEKSVFAFVKQYDEGEDVVMKIVDFLENWLVEHIAIHDKKYAECFHSHGLK